MVKQILLHQPDIAVFVLLTLVAACVFYGFCCGFGIWIMNTLLFQPPAATMTDFVEANQLVSSFTKLQSLPLLGYLKSD